MQYEVLRQQIEEGLGSGFAAAWEAGQAVDMQEAGEDAIQSGLPRTAQP